jgi:hypothetical protein
LIFWWGTGRVINLALVNWSRMTPLLMAPLPLVGFTLRIAGRKRRVPHGDEERRLYPSQQVVHQIFVVEEELGVAFLEGGEADVGETAVPYVGLVSMGPLYKQFGDLFGGETLMDDFVPADKFPTSNIYAALMMNATFLYGCGMDAGLAGCAIRTVFLCFALFGNS